MIVVNLYGSPGAGKSTTAAGVFNRLKRAGYKTELVTEYVKGAVYKDNKGALSDQFYLVAKQNHTLHSIEKHVDIAVCDASLLNAYVYQDFYTSEPESTRAMIAGASSIDMYNTYENIGFLIPRGKKYVESGRYQTEDEASAIEDVFSKKIPSIVKNKDIEFSTIVTKENYEYAEQIIFNCIVKYIQTGILT